MEFARSDTNLLIDGKVKVKIWPILKKIAPFFLIFVLLVSLVFSMFNQKNSRRNLVNCVSEIIGKMLPKNYVIEKCDENSCSYYCGLTRNCIMWKNGTIDWDHWWLEKEVFLEEGNKPCFEKTTCSRSSCKSGNNTIGLGCSYCTSRRRIATMIC